MLCLLMLIFSLGQVYFPSIYFHLLILPLQIHPDNTLQPIRPYSEVSQTQASSHSYTI
jgi:hypothetical protein